MNVCFVLAAETPYRNDFLDKLESDGRFAVTALYCASSTHWREWELPPVAHGRVVVPGREFGGRNGGFTLYLNSGLSRALEAADPTFVAIGGYAWPAMLQAAAWARRRGIPYALLSESHDLPVRPPRRTRLSRLLSHRIIKGAAVFFAASSCARAELVRRGAAPDRIFILPNAPDVRTIAGAADAAQAEQSENVVRFLFVGRLIHDKAPLDLLAAFRRAAAEVPRIRLTMVGSGPLERQLRESIDSSIAEKVQLLGFLQPQELPSLYAQHDVFVLPSVDEPFGVVVMEAMAAGLPAILSSHVGSGGDLIDDSCGRIVPAGDVDDLASAILEMAARPDLRSMGEAAREQVFRWDLDYCVQAFEQGAALALRDAEGSAGRPSSG